jgi:hypothetical protein
MKQFLFIALLMLPVIISCTTPDIPSPDISVLSPKGVSVELISPKEQYTSYVGSEALPLIAEYFLENKGDSDASGSLCISGISTAAFPSFAGCESSCTQYELIGKKDTAQLRFDIGNADRELVLQQRAVPITHIHRYDYNTDISLNACLKKNIAAAGCNIEKPELISQSKAPVTIDSLKQELISKGDNAADLQLSFEISKPGSLDLFDPAAVKDDCSLSQDIIRTVNVEVLQHPGSGASCSSLKLNQNQYRKFSENNHVTCIIRDVSLNRVSLQKPYYEPAVQIRLSYTIQEIDTDVVKVT